MAQEDPAPQPVEEDSQAADAAREYPPETYRLMSWAAIQFIHRPTIAALAYAAYAMAGFLALAAALSFFIQINIRVEAPGEIAADPGILEVQAAGAGLLAQPVVPDGARVAKNDVIGTLQMGMTEADIAKVIGGLDQNPALVDAVNRRSGVDPRIETGRTLADLGDDSIRDAAAALQAAVRQLAQSLAGEGEFERDQNDVSRLSRQLKGLLSGYLERHRLRAPAAGTLLQFDAAANENVKPGQVVAELLPENARLAVRLSVEAKDVPSLAVGQPVFHQVEAYPFQRYGLFQGEVLRIEEAHQDKGLVSYSVLASVSNPPRLPDRLAAQIRLVRGMRTSSQVIIGRKTIYDTAMDDFFRQR